LKKAIIEVFFLEQYQKEAQKISIVLKMFGIFLSICPRKKGFS